ncbi:MAG: flagellar biosynthetic protein FliP [Chlorobiaceae bacterium]|nr:flagellar biosynthetic protein FliP [Chlorobiaceae bacterium]MBA4309119.1 flagellar biosynthetic protein FliP [Chlorobiaceae bacterium]
MKRFFFIISLLIIVLTPQLLSQNQTTIPLPKIGIDIGTAETPQDVSVTLQILLLMTILTLAPSIMIMTTAYLRIIIVFHFLKTAMGTQQMPPSQLLAGIALFITFFIMAPTWERVHTDAIKPMLDGKIQLEEAYDKGIQPIREFMFKHTRDEDIELFVGLSNQPKPATRAELSTWILVPAFVISELRAGFIIGFFIFIPFIMIDMIISSILMSMGMMMLPPMMISLPFKILLFVLVDGWSLITSSLVRSFM